ncbi:MAG: uncharacterized protein QOJ19_5035 [Acidimicrobiia bacterium]|nr:uncharacterized protein [Acidimicrobiia bacterium]
MLTVKRHPALGQILDAHTHLSGSENGESAEGIVDTLDEVGIQKAFVFAPLLDTHSWQLTDDSIEHIRNHNDYCAHVCSRYPDRLFGFCVVNPAPKLAGGSLQAAVDLMVDELRRCYVDLGLRGVKMVPAGWYPHDPALFTLYSAIAELGMYAVFHSGIFLDAKEGNFCRPAMFEQVHQVGGMRAQLAHLGWPWVDETLAVLLQEQMIHGPDAAKWQLHADVSFGPQEDWQLDTWYKALTSLPPGVLAYGSDGFWPTDADQYLQRHLLPQLGLFETAATNGHVAPEGSPERAELRQRIFGLNAWDHWSSVVREPQRPRAMDTPPSTPAAVAQHGAVH